MPSATFTSSGTWTVPPTADPSSIQAYAFGEGGNSGSSVSGNHSGGGGGGGAVGGETALGGLSVGSVLSFTIGIGGSGVATTITGGSVTVTGNAGQPGSGQTAGNGGATSANTVAFGGGPGGTGVAGATHGGGAGGGSAGSTGAGGTGAAGGASASSGGIAGSGAAGPPSLAGATGGSGGAPTTQGNNGIAPGSGAGGPGDSSSRSANTGAPGQVIIIWNTLNGVGLPTGLTSIAAFLPVPSPSSLKVTATGGGSSANGILLRVRVLDNAGFPTPLNSGTTTASASTAADVAFTPEATGSLAYSAVFAAGVSPAANTGNTAVDSVSTHGTFVSTATLTANTPFTAGSSSTPATGSAAAVEVMPYGGTITTDAASPAVVNNAGSTTATTAGFVPPTGGKMILALVSMAGGTGQAQMSLTDSFGLTWAKAAEANAAGNGYAGIWYAYSPAALAFSAATPPPGVAGTAYSYTLAATGGYGNQGWTLASGSLPAGLSLSSMGVISGTPTTAGLSVFTVTVSDGFGNSTTSGSLAIAINQTYAGTGPIRQVWTAAGPSYSYGTLEVPVATTEHDWVFVSVTWQDGEDNGIAYVADNVHNVYQQCAFTPNATVNTQVFAVPNARAASTVYVSTSAFVRWLTVCIIDVTGLQAGYVVDATTQVSGGPAASFGMSMSTTQPDFILAVGSFAGTPGTITQTGTGPTWTALTWGGINGSATAGITQAASWAAPGGAASPAMTDSAASGFYSGAMVAVYSHGGLPANANPAWPVMKCQAAFGYQPQTPNAPVTWTDITTRFLGLSGPRGRNFEMDELSAADLTIHLDNFDGALSPGNPGSPYYPNVTLITPVQLTATWMGRTYTVFRGIVTAIPQTYDFQRTMTAVAVTDDFSKLAQTLLPTCMIQEMLYDQPLDLWPLNEQQGSAVASNWSGRSGTTLAPVPVSAGSGGAGAVPATQLNLTLFGRNLGVSVAAFIALVSAPGSADSGTGSTPGPATAPTVPATGFGSSNSGTWPAGLAGTTDSFWGNTGSQVTSTFYNGTALVDSNDATLPLTATGATYSVWAQMYFVPSNTNATIMTLTDQAGTAGTKNYLTLTYNGTQVTVTQTAGSTSYSPGSFLFDGKFHLWTVTVTQAGVITVYLDGAVLGSFSGTFPAGTPTMLQLGGDTTAATASAAGLYTGCQSLAGVYDRVVDPERIATWRLSGTTGFLDELGGVRVQRILAWARWNAPQAVDAGLSMQQAFNYLTGGYGNNGLTGAIGNWNTAGGSTGIDNGAQSSVTMQDVANTENAFLSIMADGTISLRQRTNIGNFPLGIALGDMDYALNSWQEFESGLGPWTTAVNCTAVQSSGWSYEGAHSALMTVTGTPVTASVRGDTANVQAGAALGFSCWVMSPQGCTVIASVDFYNAGAGFISTASTGSVNVPPMTPVLLNLTGITAPAGAVTAKPGPVITSSPATGTQLYFDHARLSPAGFQVPYMDDVEVTEDIQYLFNDVSITRNVDQASYRARDVTSRLKYYPRVFTRTVYSSVDDTAAVPAAASTLLANFSQPAVRVSRVVVDAAANPEAWPFVLSADIGDSVSFTRNPVGGFAVTGTFIILNVEPDIAKDQAKFTYILAPIGVY